MFFKKIISSFDLIAPKYEMKQLGYTSYQTIVGAILTVVVTALSLTSIGPTIDKFVNNVNPNVYISAIPTDQKKKLTPKDFSFKVRFYWYQGKSLELGLLPIEYLTTMPVIGVNTKIKDILNNNKDYHQEGFDTSTFLDKLENPMSIEKSQSAILNYPMEKCEDNKDNYSLCFPQNLTEFDADSLELRFNVNKLDLKNSTETDAIIMTIHYDQMIYNTSNYETPYFNKEKFTYIICERESISIREFQINENTIQITNNTFLVPQSRDDYTFYEIGETKEVFRTIIPDVSFPGIGENIKFTFGKNSQVMSINYITFDNVISDFGGTSSALFWFVQLIYTYFCEFFMQTDLLNSSYKFHINTY